MKQEQFIASKQACWQEFEQLCQPDNKKKATVLPAHFPALYRQICHDLAMVRSRQYSPLLAQQLNQLVLLGQQRLYSNRKNQFRQLLELAQTAFPRALYENRQMLLINLIAFWGLGLIAMIAVLIYPDWVYTLVGQSTVLDIERMYDPSGSIQSDQRQASDDALMLGFYIYNNIGIAFQMFASGLLFCVGALYGLLFNSFFFGAISGHIINSGFQAPFFSFVITHGSFELTAIIIASAAGCQMGYALLNPKQLSRSYALKLAAQKVFPLIVGAFLMLLLAAFIEAFWSPRDIDNLYKYIAGAICWAYVIFRLYRGMRYAA